MLTKIFSDYLYSKIEDDFLKEDVLLYFLFIIYIFYSDHILSLYTATMKKQKDYVTSALTGETTSWLHYPLKCRRLSKGQESMSGAFSPGSKFSSEG